MSIIIFIIILMVLVIAHEAGHFFTAKAFKIKVEEFGFGFPPRLFGWKKGETTYSVNALPFGGFVKIFGESLSEADCLEIGFLDKEDQEKKEAERKRNFSFKPKWQQALVLFAGITANFLLAWILLSVGFMSGLPTSTGSEVKGYELKDVRLVIVSVLKESPAELSGLKSGDKIVSIKTEKKSVDEITPDNLKSFILSNSEEEIEFGYIRGSNQDINFAKIIPEAGFSDGQPGIGIAMDQIGTAKLPVFRAFVEGMKLNVSVTKDTTVGLYRLIVDGIQGKGSFASVTGPVGMVGIVGDASKFGFVYLLSFAALISINLAIINFIPFPALDGGRLLFLLIEKIKGSRINPKFANTANMIGFAILILLMILITYKDVVKLF
ncbi:MAG: site-2 protease family protein [Patescibacteria group bacterium]